MILSVAFVARERCFQPPIEGMAIKKMMMIRNFIAYMYYNTELATSSFQRCVRFVVEMIWLGAAILRLCTQTL